MALKKVFTSAPGVYRTGLRAGLVDPWASTADRDRLFDEYLWIGNGLMVIENPESPTDYEIVFFCLNHERSAGVGEGANAVAMRWSGLDGRFLGHDSRANALGIRDVTVGANGTAYATWLWLLPDWATYKFDPFTYQFVEIHPAGYYSGHAQLAAVPCVDEELDLALIIGSSTHHAEREVAVHRESTGEFLYKFRVCGVVESIFMADDRRAYCVATDGTLTLVNYVTGQVLGVLSVGLSPNYRAWAWDRVSKRILCIEQTPDDMPEGHCTLRVTGYYPVPEPHGLAGPIPLQAPAVGRRVEVVSKVYGAAGEGIPGMVVNYSLADPAEATVSPVQSTTDLNGNARTFLTGVLAGDNTIIATVEI